MSAECCRQLDLALHTQDGRSSLLPSLRRGTSAVNPWADGGYVSADLFQSRSLRPGPKAWGYSQVGYVTNVPEAVARQ